MFQILHDDFSLLWRYRGAGIVKTCDVGRWSCANESHRIHFALLLLAYLLRGYHVLSVGLRHNELAQHLHLLHLGEGELIAHLHGLQVAHRGLTFQLEISPGSLFEPEISRLSLS